MERNEEMNETYNEELNQMAQELADGDKQIDEVVEEDNSFDEEDFKNRYDKLVKEIDAQIAELQEMETNNEEKN